MRLHDTNTIEEYERNGVWGEETLLDRFDKTVRTAPDRTAVVDPPNTPDLVGREPERLTYDEMGEQVDAIATGLRERGVKKDDIVVAQLPNTWELALLYLAVARAGGVISPLPVQWRRHELDHVVDHTDAAVFVTVEEFEGFDHIGMGKQALGDLDPLETVIPLAELREMAAGETDVATPDDIEIGANEVFNLQWTSGTTAAPKACPMTHNSWYVMPLMPLADLETGVPETVLNAPPLVNMTAIFCNYVPWLLTGGTLVQHHPLDLDMLVDQLQDEGVTLAVLVPAMLNRLLRHPNVDDFDLSEVETIVTGSAAPAEWALREFKERWGIEIINIWGQNEGTAIVSGPQTTPFSRRATDFPQFGGDRLDVDWNLGDSRVDTIQTKVVDPETSEVLTAEGNVGEFAFRGPGVMAGYFRQPDRTEEAFDDEGFFYTGDLFRVESEGFVSFFDRKKDVIVRGGFTISAKEVENIALEHPAVADAAAVAMPDPDLGERVCLYAVPSNDAELKLEDITDFMNDEVAIYKLPERLEVLEEMPRNPVGKVLKTDLRANLREDDTSTDTDTKTPNK